MIYFNKQVITPKQIKAAILHLSFLEINLVLSATCNYALFTAAICYTKLLHSLAFLSAFKRNYQSVFQCIYKRALLNQRLAGKLKTPTAPSDEIQRSAFLTCCVTVTLTGSSWRHVGMARKCKMCHAVCDPLSQVCSSNGKRRNVTGLRNFGIKAFMFSTPNSGVKLLVCDYFFHYYPIYETGLRSLAISQIFIASQIT